MCIGSCFGIDLLIPQVIAHFDKALLSRFILLLSNKLLFVFLFFWVFNYTVMCKCKIKNEEWYDIDLSLASMILP